MKIYLLADKTAILMDNREQTVSVLPKTNGKLYVESECFDVSDGAALPVSATESGSCRATFIDEDGVVYKVNRPRLKNGTPYTVADYATGYVSLLLKMDEIERENDRLAAEFRELAAATEPDSLGHLNIGGNEK